MKKLSLFLIIGLFMISLTSASVTLNSPENNSIAYNLNIEFNCSASSGGGLTLNNISLWNNFGGIWKKNQTTLLGFIGTLYNPDNFVNTDNAFDFNSSSYAEETTGVEKSLGKTFDSEYVTDIEINATVTSSGAGGSYIKLDTYNGTDWIENVTLVSSAGLTSTYDNTYSLNYVVSGIRIRTRTGGGSAYSHKIFSLIKRSNETENIFNSTINDSLIWNCEICYSDSTCEFAPNNFTLNIDSQSPTINITSPIGTTNFGGIGVNETLNWNVNDTNLDSCWFDYNGTNQSVICSSNTTNFILEKDNYNLTFYSNDTTGNIASKLVNWSYIILKDYETYSTTTLESKNENFIVNISYMESDWNSISAKLEYNNTNHTGTKQGSGNELEFTAIIPIPNVNQETNKTFKWIFTLVNSTDTITIESDEQNQTINQITLSSCEIGNSSAYFSFNYLDEVLLTPLSSSVNSISLEYWIDSQSNSKTFTYTNTTELFNHTFCINPSDKTYNVGIYYPYSSTGYPQRVFNPSARTFTNDTTNYTLYLLSSSDGIYVTFQVINQAQQLIQDVISNATRTISGVETLVASGLTGADGSITFWLNPDFVHTFNFFKTGYNIYTSSFAPTRDGYTIILGGGTEPEIDDYDKGVTNIISPSQEVGSHTLYNDTTYNFNYSISSSYWDIDEFGFTLSSGNGTTLAQVSSTTIPGNVSYDLNTGSYRRIVMEYYWVINGTTVTRRTYWNVFNSGNTEWSLSNFFTDLDSYLEEGMFGMDNFGKKLITFLVMFLSVGILSFKFGLDNPITISSMVFGVTFFFTYATDLITSNLEGRIAYFPVFIAGIILVTIAFREVTK